MLVCVPPSGSLTAGELSLAAMADFLAEKLLRGEGSYRQFWEKRALGEGSYRRFFGREFAEGGGQLSPILGEACPGGRQLLSPIFWQRICRACRLRGQASKGKQGIEKCRKSFKKGAKNDQKWYPGGP